MHKPRWWIAYNKVKHSNEGLKDHATLTNAIAATAAVFLLIQRIYGFGVLQGGFYNMPSTGGNTVSMRNHSQRPSIVVEYFNPDGSGNTVSMRNHPQWGRLFIRV